MAWVKEGKLTQENLVRIYSSGVMWAISFSFVIALVPVVLFLILMLGLYVYGVAVGFLRFHNPHAFEIAWRLVVDQPRVGQILHDWLSLFVSKRWLGSMLAPVIIFPVALIATRAEISPRTRLALIGLNSLIAAAALALPTVVARAGPVRVTLHDGVLCAVIGGGVLVGSLLMWAAQAWGTRATRSPE